SNRGGDTGPLRKSPTYRGVVRFDVGRRRVVLAWLWPAAGTFSGTFALRTHSPNDPIQARASSMSVRGRTIRTPSPERKCLTLCVTRRRAPAPMAAARIGTSLGSASSLARSRSRNVGRWIWRGTARRNSSKSGVTSGSLAARFRRTSATAASGSTRRRRPSSPSTRIAWLAPVRDSRPAIRTSASRQTGNGSVFAGRATQILQGQLSGSAQTFHLGSEPWHDEHSRAEEHRSIEVDDRQGVSLAEPILLAQRCREGQRPPPSDLDCHGRAHTENQYSRIPGIQGPGTPAATARYAQTRGSRRVASEGCPRRG